MPSESDIYPPSKTKWTVHESIPTTTTSPYKCPVCDGIGTVPEGFYNRPPTVDWNPPHVGTSSVPVRETCRSCAGRGILWS